MKAGPTEFWSATLAPTSVRTSTKDKKSVRGVASRAMNPVKTYTPTMMNYSAWGSKKLTVPGLWMHNSDLLPIGQAVCTPTRENLLFEMFMAEYPFAQQVFHCVESGLITQVSIGFDIEEFHVATWQGEKYRIIDSIKLYEVSLVHWGADSGAVISHPSVDDEEIAQWVAKYEPDLEIAQMIEDYTFNRLAARYLC